MIVGVLAVRVASHFGGAPADYADWEYAGSADEALAQLDHAYAAWVAGGPAALTGHIEWRRSARDTPVG